jgi:hypothetical protein
MKEEPDLAGVEYADIEEQVLFGLETIPEERTVEIPLRDLMYIHKTFEELLRFFRQRFHYPDLEAVEDFIGNLDRGAFKVIWESCYSRLKDVWPEDILGDLEEGYRFHSPKFPYYYKAGMRPPVKDTVVKESPNQSE